MVASARTILILILAGLLTTSTGFGQKFFPDDPIQAVPAPEPVTEAHYRRVDDMYLFLRYSFGGSSQPAYPAGAINTIGEVPDSAWFTNRHGRHRMSPEELQRGPGTDQPPVPPFKIVSGKNEGIQVGFKMLDSAGRVYFVKLDPIRHPEMSSGADVIVSKFLYAIGYNTPQNYIVKAKLHDFRLAHDAKISVNPWHTRKMTWGDVQDIIYETRDDRDGSFRLMASLAAEGKAMGPFSYEGTRSDDPNDLVPHENRRDLRGLYVFVAWLNHTDAKAGNTLDTLVENNGVPFIRHYLIDFGSSLGSDGFIPKEARLGHEYMIPGIGQMAQRIATLGLVPKPWEHADFSSLPAAGNFEANFFEPDDWTSNYPNPAFLRRLPDDEFWAAKIVMSFTDDDIRTIVETACYSDPRVTDYMTATLIQRRDKIGRVFFSKVLPLDHFRVQNGELQFDDLAVVYGFKPAAQYTFRWSLFDNITQQHYAVNADSSNRLPAEARQAGAGTYFSALIQSPADGQKYVLVTIRKDTNGFKVVGVERAW